MSWSSINFINARWKNQARIWWYDIKLTDAALNDLNVLDVVFIKAMHWHSDMIIPITDRQIIVTSELCPYQIFY